MGYKIKELREGLKRLKFFYQQEANRGQGMGVCPREAPEGPALLQSQPASGTLL
jgi:hypothetical protein